MNRKENSALITPMHKPPFFMGYNITSLHMVSLSLKKEKGLKLIPFFGKYNNRTIVFGFFEIHKCISNDNHHVTNLNFTCRSSIQTNTPRASFAFNDIRFKALTINVLPSTISKYSTSSPSIAFISATTLSCVSSTE